MQERDPLHIERIIIELEFINKNFSCVNKEKFLNDEMIQHALLMAFLNIGECVNRLSDIFKEQHNHIEWVKIIALRNLAAHGYWQLNMEQIWQALIINIPKLTEFFNSI